MATLPWATIDRLKPVTTNTSRIPPVPKISSVPRNRPGKSHFLWRFPPEERNMCSRVIGISTRPRGRASGSSPMTLSLLLLGGAILAIGAMYVLGTRESVQPALAGEHTLGGHADPAAATLGGSTVTPPPAGTGWP